MTEKQKLVRLLSKGKLPNLILADLKTFQWLRFDHKTLFETGELNHGIGGGLFTTVLVSFSQIDFLAQVYAWLKESKTESRKKVMWYELLEKYPEVKEKYLKLTVNYLREDWKQLFDHTETFKKLIRHSKIWGYSDSQLQRIWQSYRNPLTHMSFPKEAITGIKDEEVKSYNHLNELLNNDLDVEPFIVGEKQIECYSDLLLRDTIKLKNWVTEQVNIASEEDAANVTNWLREYYTKFLDLDID